MFSMRLLWFSWSTACLGVAGALGGYEGEGITPPQPAASASPVMSAAAVLAPGSDGRVVIPRGSDGLFYVTGTVNGTAIRFLIDTGSSLVVLTPNDAARAGLDAGTSRSSLTVRTAGGTVPMAAAHVPRIDVAGRTLAELDAAIAEGPGVSLLGQSALAQLGPITLARDRITIDRPAA